MQQIIHLKASSMSSSFLTVALTDMKKIITILIHQNKFILL